MYINETVKISPMERNTMLLSNMSAVKRSTVVIFMVVSFFTNPTLSQVSLNGPEYALQGGTVSLECRIKQFSTTSAIDNAVIKRDTGTPGLPLLRTLATKNGIHPDAPDNVDVVVSSLPDGTVRLLLTISDVTRDDAAVYTCTAGRQLPSGYISLGAKSQHLAIFYPPSMDFPKCSVSPPSPSEGLERQEGDVIQLACTSELANPHVNLIWGRTGVGTVPEPIEFMQSDTLRSEVSVTLSSSDDGVYFVCIGKSAAFQSYSENCLIGPFKLSSNEGSPPSTEVINTTLAAAVWATEHPSKCNSSFAGIMLDMESPYVIGGIAGIGFLLLLVLTIFCICCLIKCCRCCCKKKQQDDVIDDSTDMHLVLTNSKENLNEMSSKENQTPPPKYSTLAGCTTAETTLTINSEEQIKPSTPPTQQIQITRRHTTKGKEYPPPPNYPRPVKGLSLKISDRDAEMINNAVVYGNLERNGTANLDETNAYGNINRIKRSRPKSTPIEPRSTPSPTRHLQEPFKSGLANGSPLLDKKDQDGVAYSNLNSLSRRSTRPSPTILRPNKAPPPPPPESNDSSDELEKAENEQKTADVDLGSSANQTEKSNETTNRLTIS